MRTSPVPLPGPRLPGHRQPARCAHPPAPATARLVCGGYQAAGADATVAALVLDRARRRAAMLHIRLLGDFRLQVGETSVTTLNTPRVQALLAYVLLHRDT